MKAARAVTEALRPKPATAEALRQRLEATVREREQAEARLAEIERGFGPAAVDDPRQAAALERDMIATEVALRRLRAAEGELSERLATAERAEAREQLEREVAEAQAAVEAIARRIREEYPRIAAQLAGLAQAEREARDRVARAAARVQQAAFAGVIEHGEVTVSFREPADLYCTEARGPRLALCDTITLPSVCDPSARPFWPT